MADEAQVAEVAEQAVAPSEAAVATDWKQELPDDLRDHPSIANMQDVTALAKSMVHAQSLVGADKIAVPGKWADEQDWDQVYNKLGRPGSAEEYGLKWEVPDGQADPALTEWFETTAHKIGLNPKQAQALADSYIELTGNDASGQVDTEAAKAESTAALRQEYGNAFDDRIGKGDSFIGQFGAEGLMDLRLDDGTSLMNNPTFIKTVVNAAQYIHESISEDALVGDKDSVAFTPAEAEKELEQYMRDDGPYWDPRHPQHANYVERVQTLYQQIYPDGEEE